MKAIAFLAALCLAAGSTHAALINLGDVTRDDVTGLEWLDLTFTVGMSYFDVNGSLDDIDGGGWRYATFDEVDAFVTEVTGVATIGDGAFAEYDGNTDAVAAYVGYTNVDDRVAVVVGLTGTTWQIGPNVQYRSYGLVDFHLDPVRDTRQLNFAASSRDRFLDVGWWLVRPYEVAAIPVPEPGSLALLGAGIIGLGALRAKRAGAR